MNPLGNMIRRDVQGSKRPRRSGFLAGMRVRKKLIVLHTAFTLGMALLLVVGLRPAVLDVLETAEVHESKLLLGTMIPTLRGEGPARSEGENTGGEVSLWRGSAGELGVASLDANRAVAAPGQVLEASVGERGRCALTFVFTPERPEGEFIAARVQIPEARRALWKLYALACVVLLGVYAIVALTLELLVLPRHVYEPIARILEADAAVKQGRGEEELVPEWAITSDELGSIMRSRNETIQTLRRQEEDLAVALRRLEEAAADLKKKNHLLEAAKRNLADADRLAGLGMMSAGIAHELNTPLAVLKGLVEKLNEDPRAGVDPAMASLMLRVVGRLERLGEGLLDYARVRPVRSVPTDLRAVVHEAATLVGLDREARRVAVRCEVPEGTIIEGDAARLTQVFVNLIRNGCEAVRASRRDSEAGVLVEAEEVERDGLRWVQARVVDDGVGIDAKVMAQLFEPFVSTRLDSRGTGLGLAVSEGIVREHGGVLVARNREGGRGAIFEAILPTRRAADVRPLEMDVAAS